MTNFSIKADLLKIKGAFLTNLKGKAAVKALSFAYSADCDSRNHLQRIIDAIEQAQKDVSTKRKKL